MIHPPRALATLAAIGLALATFHSHARADWLHYRGPAMNGVSNEKGWSAQFPATGPRQLWKVDLGTGTASVTANYLASCTIAANPLAFGSLTSTTAAVGQSTTIQTQCSGNTPFTLSLNGGLIGATDPAAREMQHGADRLRYGLYRDSGYSQPWGSTIGSNVFTSTGSGASQAIQVYGRVQAQTTPPSGNYTDTVIVTIDY